MSASPQTYRPEIDGLRAVAIVSVVLYHAWPSVVPGGFVGVDVFFVISGYLITRIIVAPNFSFAHFYRRRIRRIFPALLVVLAATVALGQTLLPPNEYRNLLRYAIGGGLFVANIVAYGNDSYFSGASELKPLVHLWSLGVEEQFYLLWPVLVRFALARGVLTRAIAWTAIASLAVFLWWSESDPRAAFYLAPSRFWELLLGAVLAGTAWTGRASSLGSAAGLAMIAASAVLIDSETAFPGAQLALPVIGAALIIGTPSRSLASRLLASRPAVWVGLISYPLYLWHWPLLSLLRNFERAPSSFAIGAAVVLSIALAEATRRLVERPVHSLRLAPLTGGLAGCMIATIGVLSLLFATSPGEDRELTNSSCVRRYPYQAQSLWFCTLSKDAAPTILLLGDSHANHLYGGLSRALPSESVLSIGACMPTPGLVYPGGKGENGTCYNENFAAQSAFLNARVIGTPTLKRVVVSAMWRAFDKAGNEIDYGSGKVISTFDPVDGTPLHSYVAALERQIERIGDVPITIVLDTPRRGVSVQVQRERQSALRGQITELAARHSNVRVFDPMPLLCADSWCRWSLLSDAHHLSRPGSDLIGEALAKQ